MLGYQTPNWEHHQNWTADWEHHQNWVSSWEHCQNQVDQKNDYIWELRLLPKLIRSIAKIGLPIGNIAKIGLLIGIITKIKFPISQHWEIANLIGTYQDLLGPIRSITKIGIPNLGDHKWWNLTDRITRKSAKNANSQNFVECPRYINQNIDKFKKW